MWIAFLTPVLGGDHVTGYERDVLCCVPADDEAVLAVARSGNVTKYCLVEARTRRQAQHKARLMFDHRQYARYLVRNSLKKAKMV